MTKTRLVANVNGSEAELISLQENQAGDVQVFIRSALNHEISGADMKTLQEKFSIHVTPTSPGTIIKKTTRLQGQTKVRETKASFVKDSKKSLLWFFYGRGCTSMRAPFYYPKFPADDTVVCIAPYVPADHTLLYILVAQRAGEVAPELQNYRCDVFPFELFQVVVYTTFFNYPSIGRGTTIDSATSPLQIDDVPDGPAFGHGAASIPLAEFAKNVDDHCRWLIIQLRHQLFAAGVGVDYRRPLGITSVPHYAETRFFPGEEAFDPAEPAPVPRRPQPLAAAVG